MKQSLLNSSCIELRWKNFENIVYWFFVFRISQKLLVPHTQNGGYFSKNSIGEGL